jgi:hypothetical protein
VVAFGAALVVMADAELAPQEHPQLEAIVQGRDAVALGYGDPVVARERLAADVDATVLAAGGRVLLDAYQGAAIAAQVPKDHADRLVMSFDRRFETALADPHRHAIDYVLLPDPASWPQDAVNRARPRLWSGREPGFRLVRAYDAGPAYRLPENWRLFAVERGVRVLPPEAGGPR